jgi:hypothetical protein
MQPTKAVMKIIIEHRIFEVNLTSRNAKHRPAPRNLRCPEDDSNSPSSDIRRGERYPVELRRHQVPPSSNSKIQHSNKNPNVKIEDPARVSALGDSHLLPESEAQGESLDIGNVVLRSKARQILIVSTLLFHSRE